MFFNFMDELRQAGIPASLKEHLVLLEALDREVIERNPEVIVVVNYGEVTAEQKIAFMKNNPAFSRIDAVKNDRFVVLEYVEATPGPRNIDAIARLAKAFHPKNI